MKVKIKKLNPAAVIPYKTHESDFCYDCVAVSCEELAPRVYRYGLGIALQIERDETDKRNISIDFRPRSSVWRTGMILSNCEGTVDEGYTGEISAVFYHVVPGLPGYKVGDRIGQIKLGFTEPMKFVEVEDLDQTERGEGAYGSTGK